MSAYEVDLFKEKTLKTDTVLIPINLSFFEGGGQDKDSKTEQPTPKKLEKAREEGQVAKSQEVSTALTLLIMFFSLRLLAPWLYHNIQSLLFYNWGYIPHGTDMLDSVHLSGFLTFLFSRVLLIAAPLLAISFIVGVISNLLQVGWHPTVKPIMPKFNKFNPISGVKRIFSMQSVVNLLKSLAKFGVIGLIVFFMIRGEIGMIPLLPQMSLFSSFAFIGNFIVNLGLTVGGFFIFIALADYAYTRYAHIKKLKMTKQEVKDEWKQMEGDPQIKSKIRQKMREASMRRMMQNVPEADVIITNPTHFAVALRYNNLIDKAPVVVAKGVDFAAKRIREKGKEHNVPIVENPTLARSLYAEVEVGNEIPTELWESVIEVLAYVFKLRNQVS